MRCGLPITARLRQDAGGINVEPIEPEIKARIHRWMRFAALGLGLLLSPGMKAAHLDSPNHFVAVTNFGAFESRKLDDTVVLISPLIYPRGPWTELVVSWNATCPSNGLMQVETRAFDHGRFTKYYAMGRWSETRERESVRQQRDADGEVATDTLVCTRAMEAVQLRFILSGAPPIAPTLKFIGLAFHDARETNRTNAAQRPVEIRALTVPERAQIGHAEADGWCSPTCVSMILAYWSTKLQRSELDLSVPAVADAVFDRNWPGTGNWAFNMAFAGRFKGMRAYVTRLDDLSEVEAWLASGVPVALSVSFDFLNGKPEDQGNGHLIVVVGFTENGDVIVNDPWPAPTKENSVRKVFPRQNVIKAWQRSKGAVYIIRPVGHSIPADSRGHWAD